MDMPEADGIDQIPELWGNAFREIGVYLKPGSGRHADGVGVPLKEYCRRHGYRYQTIWSAIMGLGIPHDETVLDELCRAAH